MLNKSKFEKMMGQITRAWSREDYDEASPLISRIRSDGTTGMKADALLFSGLMKMDKGDFHAARIDWVEAIGFSTNGGFTRYSLQVNVGKSFEKEGFLNDARKWYRDALQTAAEGDDFSSQQVLESYLSLNRNQVLIEDRLIIIAAIEKSWRVLELSGNPNLSDLAGSIASLNEGFETNLRRAKDE